MWQGACCVVAHGVRKNITSDIVSTKYLSIARTSFLHPRATRPEIGEGRSFGAQLRLPPRGYVRGCRWRQEVTEEHSLSRFYIIGTTSVVPKKKAGSQLGAKNIAISAYEELVRTVKRSEADKLRHSEATHHDGARSAPFLVQRFIQPQEPTPPVSAFQTRFHAFCKKK